jgi:adenylylsulfate kinase
VHFCLWITGLPGSGKTAIAVELEAMLKEAGVPVFVLSMDRARQILTPEPKYDEEEREIVYRALVAMAKMMVEHGGKNILIDATGNRRAFRELARQLISQFAEGYVDCPIDVAQAREASRKGQLVEHDLYQKARAGTLKGRLPGVTASYEAPLRPEVAVSSDTLNPRECATIIMNYIASAWMKGENMMSEKDAYVEKLKAQLDEWNAELDKLEAEARKADAETRLNYEKHMKELRRRSDEAQRTLTELRNAKDDAWEDLKQGAQTAWDVLKTSLSKATSEFKRGYREGVKEEKKP